MRFCPSTDVLWRNKRKSILITIIALLLVQSTFASQEGMLSFSEFKIQSNGIGESGVANDKTICTSINVYYRIYCGWSMCFCIQTTGDILLSICWNGHCSSVL